MGERDSQAGVTDPDPSAFRQLFEHAPFACIQVGPDGRVVRANARLARLTGYDADQLCGTHVLDLCADTPAGRGRAKQLFERFLTGQACHDEPLEVRRADGSALTLRLTRQPAVDADGRFAGAYGLLTEGAGHGPERADRQGEDALQAAALASIGNAVIVTEPDGTIAWVNDAFTQMSGYSAAEAIGSTPRLLKSGVHGQDHYEQLWSTIKDQRIWRGEVVERRKDGQLYTVWQTITPILDEHGQISHFVAVHEDVTQLRASQARLQALFDHATDAILLVDDDARLLEANPAVSSLSGYRADELATMTLADLVAEDARDDYADRWARFPAEQQGRGSLPIRHRDGDRVEIEYQSVASIADGVHLIVARDVSDQRRAVAQQRFQAQLLEAVGDAVVATDLDGRVRYVNPAAEQLYGWDEAQVLGRSIAEVLLPPDATDRLDGVLEQVRHGQVWTNKLEERRSDGTTHTALVTFAPYLDESGRPAGSISVSTDISDLEHTQQLLARRARQQAAVAELGRQAASTDDPREVGSLATATARQLLESDVTVELAWGTDPIGAAGADTVRIDIGGSGTLVVSGRDAPALSAEDVEFLRSLANVVHATLQRHAAVSQLEHLATHDPLTGLANRSLFLDRLEQTRATNRRTGGRFAVLFLDLDGLKSINDGLGHEIGDEVLQLVAERISGVVRPSDTVARFGGDEFAVLCTDVADEQAAGEVTERIRTVLDTGLPTNAGTVSVTASVGIVLGDADTDGGALLRDVDTAMYAAKGAGRNRTEVFDTRMREHAQHRYRMTATLQRALEDGSIEVHYQPTIEVATGRIVGAEALARLRGDDGELFQPNDFIWVAEESGLIGALGAQVLGRACADACPWLASDPEFMLSVNVSPRQLTHHDIAATIVSILAEACVDPTHLWLEITESALLSGPGVRTAMHRLRQAGIRFAIDDFGTGYSSMAHLRQMPVSMLKIDRSFVSGVHADIQDHALVAATIDLARTFGLPTTAEGVETPEQLAELTRLGGDYAQGFLWSRPVPPDEITAMLAAGPPRPG